MADRVFRPAALGNPRFRLLLPGQVAAVAGEQMFAVAITVSVLQAGGDAVALGLVLAARGVTLVVFLPVGGVWADRLPRQRVLMAAYGLQALLAAALAVTGTFPIWAAAGAVLLSGLAEAFVRPAFNALLQGVLGDHERVSGRSLVSVAIRTGVMAGPAAGAGVITLSGAGAAYGITAMTFAVAVLTLWRAGEPRREPARRASFVQDVRAGVAEARRLPWVRAILIFSAVNLMFVIAPTQVLLPVVTTAAFGSPAVYGLALTCYGAGGLAGGLITMAWRPRAPGAVALTAIALYAAAPLSLVLAPSPAAIFLAFAIAGAGVETYAIHWEVALQREIPEHLIGRISSFAWLCGFGLMPFGQALTGPLAALAGPAAVLASAAAVILLVPPALLLVRGMPRFRDPP
ncbi:MFS transporter [Nonomuraea sp. NPDC050478]|uniref:MFS transporter n=1 Tax=Nonomuraea sp. NPDC050478 TaxID=3364365 RepID=UPI0037AE9C48